MLYYVTVLLALRRANERLSSRYMADEIAEREYADEYLRIADLIKMRQSMSW